MSTWHYQLIKHVYPKDDVTYGVHEYYPATDEVGEAWTLLPIGLSADSEEDVIWVLEAVLNDIKKYGVKEVEHDDYGVVHAENAGVKPCAMCGDKG